MRRKGNAEAIRFPDLPAGPEFLSAESGHTGFRRRKGYGTFPVSQIEEGGVNALPVLPRGQPGAFLFRRTERVRAPAVFFNCENSGIRQEGEREAIEDDGQFNEGLSLDYTYGFVFGKTDENNLFTPNKFGFSLNTGLIFSFDKQNRYGTTFDLLFKFGLETGFNHPLGLAVDLLLGTGKSCGDFLYDITTDDGNTEDMEIPYTDWCFKKGFRISVRSNLLNTQLKNTDVRLFFQYIDSKNPYNDAELREISIYNKWQEQSWSFGLLLVRYL